MNQSKSIFIVAVTSLLVVILLLLVIILLFGKHRKATNVSKTVRSVTVETAEAESAATTAAPTQTTAAASVSAVTVAPPKPVNPAPAKTTAAPAKTTAAPEKTTAAPEKTTVSTEYLSRSEIISLLEQGNVIGMGWVHAALEPQLDRENDTFREEGFTYCLITDGRYKTLDALKDAVHACYTDAVYNEYAEMLYSYYKMKDGKFYGIEELGQGGDVVPYEIRLEILSESATECKVRVVSYKKYSNNTEESSADYTLVSVNGQWKFTKMVAFYANYGARGSELFNIPWAN